MAHSSSPSREQEWEEKSRIAQAALGDEIMDKTFRRTEDEGRHAFITQHILEKIWTDERLADVFAGMDSLDLTRTKGSHLKIMSVLVVMEWTRWSQFKAIFINYPGRTDADLPLADSAIAGPHFSKTQVQNFVQSQSMFLPAEFRENEDRDVPSAYQMPFEAKPEIVSQKGSFCSIEAVTIVSRQYYDSQGEPNANPKKLIRKLCYVNDPTQDLEEEKEILSKLRNSLFDDSRVMTSLGTFNQLGTPRTLSIFFPVAEFDLDDYLFGKKNSNSIKQYPIDPTALIEEFACLAHALGYLHNDIRLSHGGEHFVCIHHDLKPANILVVAERGAPVGRWKVTDFGLSRVKEAKKSPRGSTLYDHVPSVWASITTPKRHRGAFQAPEIGKQGEKVVSPRSDVWALCCILCLVLIYAVGGNLSVKDFQTVRLRQKQSQGPSKSYEDDYFYSDNEIKPEVISALQEISEKGVWAQNCVDIIKKTLHIEPSERPNAKLVESWLFDRVLNELSKNAPSATPKDLRTPPRRTSEQPQGVQTPPMHQGPSIGNMNVSVRNSQPQGPEESTTSKVASRALASNWTPYPSIQSSSLDSTFVTFKIAEVATQTLLSSCCDFVAFLMPSNVYVHSIALLDENDRWANKPSGGKVRANEGTSLIIRPPENTVWRAMSLSGAYLALRGYNRKDQQAYACAYKLNMNARFKIDVDRVFVKNQSAGLVGIAVSVKGDIVLQFASIFDIYSVHKDWEDPSRVPINGLKNVTFTVDGTWLLAWSDDKGSMHSHFYAVSNLGSGCAGCLSKQSNQTSFAVCERMIPFHTIPAFVIFDERPGLFRFVQYGSIPLPLGHVDPPKETLSTGHLASIRAGAVTPASNAVVLARKNNKVVGATLSLSVTALAAGGDQVLQPQFPRDLYKCNIDISDSNKKPCDIALKVHAGSGLVHVIFISYLNGTLERIACSYPESQGSG